MMRWEREMEGEREGGRNLMLVVDRDRKAQGSFGDDAKVDLKSSEGEPMKGVDLWQQQQEDG